MPRKRRAASPTGIYHWIIRGIHKKKIFHQEQDFEYFKALILEHGGKTSTTLYHYCLMHNHVHLLINCPDPVLLGNFSHFLVRRYAYYYCKTYKWSGGVFQRPYKAFAVDDERYLLECGRYVERNPLKAHLTDRPDAYTYSSYCHYKHGSVDLLIPSPSPAYVALDDDETIRRKMYAHYVEAARPAEEFSDKRLAKG